MYSIIVLISKEKNILINPFEPNIYASNLILFFFCATCIPIIHHKTKHKFNAYIGFYVKKKHSLKLTFIFKNIVYILLWQNYYIHVYNISTWFFPISFEIHNRKYSSKNKENTSVLQSIILYNNNINWVVGFNQINVKDWNGKKCFNNIII